MAEIVEVLNNAHLQCLYFDVDNTVDYVVAVAPGAPPTYAQNGTGKNIFQKGDSFRLLSCGFTLPESFTPFYNNAFAISSQLLGLIAYGVTSGLTYYNPNWPSSQQVIPMENYELVVDSYFSCVDSYRIADPTKNLLTENFRLHLYMAYAPYISMIGVPSSMNGKRFYIRPFIKVLHTLPLT